MLQLTTATRAALSAKRCLGQVRLAARIFRPDPDRGFQLKRQSLQFVCFAFLLNPSSGSWPVRYREKQRWLEYPHTGNQLWFETTALWLLKYAAREQGLPIQPTGFVNVEDVLKHPKFRGLDVKTFYAMANADIRERFVFSETREGLFVRAKGQTIPGINTSTGVAKPEHFPELVFCQPFTGWTYYEKLGLRAGPDGLIHLHRFIPRVPIDFQKNGRIEDQSHIAIVIDVLKAASAGIKFFKDVDALKFMAQPEDGQIPPSLFKRVTRVDWTLDDITNTRVLD
ncbi:hypothetical protein C8J56DRAFT_203293 [Mycena floridula]|nr:hypothetical protein C8J56DRAFT_203293 [Mycena floridula]